jgi:hypothetical protein
MGYSVKMRTEMPARAAMSQSVGLASARGERRARGREAEVVDMVGVQFVREMKRQARVWRWRKCTGSCADGGN